MMRGRLAGVKQPGAAVGRVALADNQNHILNNPRELRAGSVYHPPPQALAVDEKT